MATPVTPRDARADPRRGTSEPSARGAYDERALLHIPFRGAKLLERTATRLAHHLTGRNRDRERRRPLGRRRLDARGWMSGCEGYLVKRTTALSEVWSASSTVTR